MAHYVTFDQAKWLKEKGFNYHKIFQKFADYYDYYDRNVQGRVHESDFSQETFPDNKWIAVPEQHQVVEWLLEKNGIWVSVVKIDGFQKLFYYTITGSNGFKNGQTIVVEEWDDETCDKMGYNNKYLNSPQEAYSAAFDYIKEKNLI